MNKLCTAYSKFVAFLVIVTVLPVQVVAYPIVSNDCKDDPVKCAKEGNLDKIAIYGVIGRDDAELIAAVDRVLWSFQKFPTIYLDSPGGSVQSAVQIGRILRKRDATVISGSPFFDETFVECSSACVDLAAGATKRHLSHIGIHNSHISKFLGPRKWTRIPAPQEAVEEDLKYFDEMGINPEIKKIIQDTPWDQMKHFFFNSDKSRDSQKIVQLGFNMPNGPPLPELKHPLTNIDLTTIERTRFINAINYGSNAAIHDYVNELLETDAGQETNYAEANIWLQVGADRNDPWSLHTLGFHTTYGKGTEPSAAKGFQYFLRAAQRGLAASQNNAGWHYYRGDGVERNIPEAILWITRAANQGEPFAFGSLCEMYDAGDAFAPNDIEQYKWCWLAVNSEPEGHARDGDAVIFEKLKARMSAEAIKNAKDMENGWKSLINPNGGMRDTDDG